jgi:hypothetical protein
MRRAARTDANKDDIVKALREAGASVYDLRMPVDLLVGYQGASILMELKDGSKPPSARKKTDAQIKFWDEWTGGPLVLVTDVESALRMLRIVSAKPARL